MARTGNIIWWKMLKLKLFSGMNISPIIIISFIPTVSLRTYFLNRTQEGLHLLLLLSAQSSTHCNSQPPAVQDGADPPYVIHGLLYLHLCCEQKEILDWMIHVIIHVSFSLSGSHLIGWRTIKLCFQLMARTGNIIWWKMLKLKLFNGMTISPIIISFLLPLFLSAQYSTYCHSQPLAI